MREGYVMNKMVSLGGNRIGRGASCFIAAEIGINHNGDLSLAKKMILEARRCGANAVKFQYYCTEDFLIDKKLQYTYISQGKKVTESQFDMFKRCELDIGQIRQLKKFCDKKNIIFFCTPSSKAGVDELLDVGIDFLKNSSDNFLNYELIKHIAKKKVPLILSTGMSTLDEIDETVDFFKINGGKQLILLHCVSQYPTPPEELNLRRIQILSEKYDCPIGFSDHSEGLISSIGAVALGACFVEKHFTIDKNLPGPDHRFSADIAELGELIKGIRIFEKNITMDGMSFSKKEESNRRKYLLSCVTTQDLKKGEIYSIDKIGFKRPGTGILANRIDSFLGKKSKRFLAKNTFLKESDIN